MSEKENADYEDTDADCLSNSNRNVEYIHSFIAAQEFDEEAADRICQHIYRCYQAGFFLSFVQQYQYNVQNEIECSLV